MHRATRILYTGTVEFLTATFTADSVLDAQPIEFSFDRTTWWPGSWIGVAGTTRKARILLGTDVPLPARGSHPVYVRLTDSPEAPVTQAGILMVL